MLSQLAELQSTIWRKKKVIRLSSERVCKCTKFVQGKKKKDNNNIAEKNIKLTPFYLTEYKINLHYNTDTDEDFSWST